LAEGEGRARLGAEPPKALLLLVLLLKVGKGLERERLREKRLLIFG
jgi:hypothetical protein